MTEGIGLGRNETDDGKCGHGYDENQNCPMPSCPNHQAPATETPEYTFGDDDKTDGEKAD